MSKISVRIQVDSYTAYDVEVRELDEKVAKVLMAQINNILGEAIGEQTNPTIIRKGILGE